MDVNALSAIIYKEDVASYFQKQRAQLRVSSILCCHVMLTLISFLTAETTARIAPDAIADTSAMHDTSKGNQWPVLDLRAHAHCAMHTGTRGLQAWIAHVHTPRSVPASPRDSMRPDLTLMRPCAAVMSASAVWNRTVLMTVI